MEAIEAVIRLEHEVPRARSAPRPDCVCLAGLEPAGLGRLGIVVADLRGRGVDDRDAVDHRRGVEKLGEVVERLVPQLCLPTPNQ